MIQALIAFLVAIATAVGGLTTASTHATPTGNDHAIQAIEAAGPRDVGSGVNDHTGTGDQGLARALDVVTNQTARDAIQKAMDRGTGGSGAGAPFPVPPVPAPPTSGRPGTVPPVTVPPVDPGSHRP